MVVKPISNVKHQIFSEFTSTEVCELLSKLLPTENRLGLPLLNYYVKTKIITPSGKTTFRGRRKFTFKDVVLLYWLLRLKREGLQLNRFKDACETLRKKIKKHSDLLDLVLATDGEKVYLRSADKVDGLVAQVLSGSNKGQYVWVFGFKNLTEEIESVLNCAKSSYH